MIWQEYVFLLGSVGQVAMLWPMVMFRVKPPLKSSVPVGITLAVYALVFVTLSQWLSAAAMAAVAAVWFLLAYQRVASTEESTHDR